MSHTTTLAGCAQTEVTTTDCYRSVATALARHMDPPCHFRLLPSTSELLIGSPVATAGRPERGAGLLPSKTVLICKIKRYTYILTRVFVGRLPVHRGSTVRLLSDMIDQSVAHSLGNGATQIEGFLEVLLWQGMDSRFYFSVVRRDGAFFSPKRASTLSVTYSKKLGVGEWGRFPFSHSYV